MKKNKKKNNLIIEVSKEDFEQVKYELKRMFLILNSDLSKATTNIEGEPQGVHPYTIYDLQQDSSECLASIADILGLERLYLDDW